MNVVREINKINEQELQLGVKGSWHDEYKDSAYVFVGGLSYDLTEGDVITIMSQFGEVIDINMPRDKETGKPKGFSFLMYEDQRSTVLAVDNMNGAQVLGRTIRVDHCKKYEQKGTKNAEGDYVAPEEPTYNAMPPTLDGSSDESSSDSEADDIDEDDPMAAYIRQQKKTKKLTDGKKRKRNGEGEGESKEAHRARKEEKRRRKEERDRKRRERELKKAGSGSRRGDREKEKGGEDRAESSRGARRERLTSEDRDTPKRSSLPAREDRAHSRDIRRTGDEGSNGSRARYDEDKDDGRVRYRDEGRYRSRDRDDRSPVPRRDESPRLDDRDRYRGDQRRDDRDGRDRRDRRRNDDPDRHERRPRDDNEGDGRNGDERHNRR